MKYLLIFLSFWIVSCHVNHKAIQVKQPRIYDVNGVAMITEYTPNIKEIIWYDELSKRWFYCNECSLRKVDGY